MKIVSYKGNSPRFNLLLEFILYSILYTLTFLFVESLFESFIICSSNKVLWAFLSVALIYILNKILKPILVTITIPITALTFGLFYFVINVVILKVADLLMGNNLNFTDIWALVIISLLLSLLNTIIEKIIIDPLLRKAKKI